MKQKIRKLLILILLFTPAGTLYPSETDIYENLIKTVNTDGDETSCSLSADGKTFVFTRREKKSKQYDIFITEYKNGKWEKPEPIKATTTEFDEISPYLTKDGKYLIFSSNRTGSIKAPRATKASFDVYISEKKSGSWGKPEKIGGYINSEDDETNAFLTDDGKQLYLTRTVYNNSSKSVVIEAAFAKDIPEENMNLSDVALGLHIRVYMVKKSVYNSGFWVSAYREGKRNIYFIYYDEEGNRKLIDPGESINTTGDENSVNEISKNLILLSCNDGISGSYDIHLKTVPSGLIPEPVEEKKENQDGKNFTEEKKSEQGEDNINDAGTEIKKDDSADKKLFDDALERTFVINVESESIDNPQSVSLKVLMFDTINTWKDPVETRTMNPDDNNSLEIKVSKKIKRIIIIPAGSDIDSFSAEYIIGKNTPMTGAIRLTRSSVKKFSFKPVYFEFNSSEIQLGDIPYMHELLEYLRTNSDIKLSIEGYSDGSGSYRGNMNTSIRRAKKVREYLVKRGITGSRISIKGHGFVAGQSGDTAQQHRRVEFLIVK